MRKPKKVTRVDKLTKAQAARMPEWVERWTRIGLCTEPADRPRAEAAIRAYYRAAGLPEPKRIAWTTSPLAGAHAYAGAALILAGGDWAASVGDSVRASVDDSVDASVAASVRAIVRASVAASVRDSVRASVDDSVGASVRASVGDSVGDSVHASVGASVGDRVAASVDASVGDSVDDSVGARVHASVRDSVAASVGGAYRAVLQQTWHRRLGGQFWAGWGWGYWTSPSMLSFLRDVCGLDFGTQTEIVDAIISLAESCCWWWPHRECALACERPSNVDRDEAGRLHSETGPACGWGDGWGVYALHGVRVPAWLIEQPERLTVQTIEAERNEEVRRVMIERYGLARYVRDAQFELLDADTDPLGQPRRLLRRGDTVVVELTNSTVDADGTRRVYHVACEPELRPLLPDGRLGEPQEMTALAAVASTYGMRAAEYRLEVET